MSRTQRFWPRTHSKREVYHAPLPRNRPHPDLVVHLHGVDGLFVEHAIGWRSWLLQAVYVVQDKQQVAVVKGFQAIQRFLNELRVAQTVIEELLRADTEVVADGEELPHWRQALAGGNVVDVAPAVSQVIAHLVFGHALLQAQLRDSVADKFLVHGDSLLSI